MNGFPRRIAILGSTGSIGQQTLDVVRCYPEHFQVVGLAARNSVALLAKQAREFGARAIATTADDPASQALADELLPGALRGMAGLIAVATHPEVDMVVVGTSGLVGIHPTLEAVRAGKTIALANKEALVMAGHLLTYEAERHSVAIYPVDSEHSAIWQCLRGERAEEVRRLFLTASGGPFRDWPLEALAHVTVEQALAHPTWQMGPKVTIDSATLMNKGLEVIEAHWLFGIPYEQIEAVIHRESIVHSMVEFIDGSIKMQASLPSMHLPIQDALSYPLRLDRAGTNLTRELRWPEVGALHFAAVDEQRFPCFAVAREAGARGGTYPCVLVSADEEAVALFLQGRIGLLEIGELIDRVMQRHTAIAAPDLADILGACEWARAVCGELAAAASH
jgi:1-deoxy-D-xylulose-5-phosphate reductoisomerase